MEKGEIDNIKLELKLAHTPEQFKEWADKFAEDLLTDLEEMALEIADYEPGYNDDDLESAEDDGWNSAQDEADAIADRIEAEVASRRPMTKEFIEGIVDGLRKLR